MASSVQALSFEVHRLKMLPFVTSRTNKVHAVAGRFERLKPAYEWRTKCGWKFGLSTLHFLEQISDQPKCSVGFPADGAEEFDSDCM